MHARCIDRRIAELMLLIAQFLTQHFQINMDEVCHQHPAFNKLLQFR
jgi:hypothetical protein